jgi:CheY-like chemotaxis protein
LTELIPAGDYVLLSVSDTGVGMDSKTVEHAFEPFFTTKPVGKGTGLGLSQVYGFVRQSQGYVRLYSEPGIGTTVKIFLPRLIGPSVAPSPQAKICEPAPARGEMILVVEDHEPLREHSSEILRELGYAVIEAPNGPAALALLDQFPQARLLFTDVVLPEGMNGRQLADEAMRRRPGLKVLYTTGYTRDVVLNAGQLGPDLDVLPKPFTYLELAAKLRSMLDGD